MTERSGMGIVVETPPDGLLTLSPERSELIIAALAAGHRIAVVTGEGAALSDPLRAVLVLANARWAVRNPDGTLRDGFSGRPLARVEEAFTDAPADASVQPRQLLIEQPELVQLVFSASVRHRPADETRLGGGLEIIADLAAIAPLAWGPHEPGAYEWDPDRLTAFARARMPETTRLVVTGGDGAPLAATIEVSRTEKGVEEVVTGILGLGAPGSRHAVDRLAAVPETLARLTTLPNHALPLVALAFTRVGRSDLATAPVIHQDPEPVAALLGAPVVRDLALDVHSLSRELGAWTAGRPRVPALVIPFRVTGGEPTGWERVSELVARLPQPPE